MQTNFKLINTIDFLPTVQQANSGHPAHRWAPPSAFTIWTAPGIITNLAKPRSFILSVDMVPCLLCSALSHWFDLREG